MPHLHRDWAYPAHICTGTALIWDWARISVSASDHPSAHYCAAHVVATLRAMMQRVTPGSHVAARQVCAHLATPSSTCESRGTLFDAPERSELHTAPWRPLTAAPRHPAGGDARRCTRTRAMARDLWLGSTCAAVPVEACVPPWQPRHRITQCGIRRNPGGPLMAQTRRSGRTVSCRTRSLRRMCPGSRRRQAYFAAPERTPTDRAPPHSAEQRIDLLPL